MPMGGMRLVQASYDQWLAAVMLLFVVLRWPEPEAEGVLAGVPPLNKLAGVPDLVLDFILSCFSLSYHGGGQKEEGGRGSNYRTIHVRPWSPIFAATGRGFRCRSEPSVVLITVLLHLMVEGRPLGVSAMETGSFISSRPSSQKGGSLVGASAWYFHCLPPVLCRRCCSHSSAPSGLVPGGGGIGPGTKLATRTRLRFSFVLWGPICKVCGLSCNFQFLLGPYVNCCMVI